MVGHEFIVLSIIIIMTKKQFVRSKIISRFLNHIKLGFLKYYNTRYPWYLSSGGPENSRTQNNGIFYTILSYHLFGRSSPCFTTGLENSDGLVLVDLNLLGPLSH